MVDDNMVYDVYMNKKKHRYQYSANNNVPT